jgi:hypothetical protein
MQSWLEQFSSAERWENLVLHCFVLLQRRRLFSCLGQWLQHVKKRGCLALQDLPKKRRGGEEGDDEDQ